jgi:selenocysteine-specific elongation factor
VAAIAAGALAPPTLAEIGGMLSCRRARRGALQAPIADHTVVKVSEELCVPRLGDRELKQRLVAHLDEHKEITTQQFKELVGRQPEVRHPAVRVLRPGEGHLRVGEKAPPPPV